MPITKVPCDMIDDACKDSLRSAFQYTFASDAERDAHFSAALDTLENDGHKQTIAFIGTNALKYAYWNGADRPSTYDPQHWVEIPIDGSAGVQDTVYWGSPSTDLSMRARRDQVDGHLIFERRIAGQWVMKFEISNSASVDSMKFIESLEMPIVRPGELGLFAAKLLDSEHGDAAILRPVFMDSNHNHYATVAAAPDGSLRIPQNIEAALANPTRVPLTYKRAVLNDQGDVMRNALSALTGNNRLDVGAVKNLPAAETGASVRDKLMTLGGDARLDASAVKNLPVAVPMTGSQIINAIEMDPANPRLPASYISELTDTEYTEVNTEHAFDPVNKTYMELVFHGTGAVTQTMPNLANTRDGARLMIRNLKTDGSNITLVPANVSQKINGASSMVVPTGGSVLFVALLGDDEWHVESESMPGVIPIAGITVDDGTTRVPGVTTLNVSGMQVEGGGGAPNTIALVSGVNIHMGPPNQTVGNDVANEIIVLPPSQHVQ